MTHDFAILDESLIAVNDQETWVPMLKMLEFFKCFSRLSTTFIMIFPKTLGNVHISLLVL